MWLMDKQCPVVVESLHKAGQRLERDGTFVGSWYGGLDST